MNEAGLNEADTRAELIDPALKDAGWGVVEASRVRREVITLGRLQGGGKRAKQDIADYVLIYRGQKLAVIDGQGPQMLKERRIDAWVVDEFEAVAIARASYGELIMLPEPAALGEYGFVMGTDREELKPRLDVSLAALREAGLVADLRERFGLERDSEWPVRCRPGA